MNKKPVSYLQTDSKWASKPYRVSGETSTVGGSGCGPTCASMIISTLTRKQFTPLDACNWSVKNGYKALNQGTFYSYFAPQLKAYGITCWQLSWTNVYHKPNSNIHTQALNYVKQGYYVIALMKEGLWTSGGHFVLVWWADNNHAYINDPASTRTVRVVGDINTFRNEAAYYWIVDAREYNNAKVEVEEELKQEDFDKMFLTSMQKYRQSLQDNDASNWSQKAREFAVKEGLFSGGGNGNFMWEDFISREQCAQLFYNFALKHGLAQ